MVFSRRGRRISRAASALLPVNTWLWPLKKMEPSVWLVPLRVMALMLPPVKLPAVTVKGETATCTSCTLSRLIGCVRARLPGVPVA